MCILKSRSSAAAAIIIIIIASLCYSTNQSFLGNVRQKANLG